MKSPFENITPPPELVARAFRECDVRGYPSAMVRPFVKELVERGDVTAEEWAVRMNSYERSELVPKLRLDVFLKHFEYCLSQCSRCPAAIVSTYDEAVIYELAPDLIRRLRAIIEEKDSA